MAKKYKSYDNVLFEICNEPNHVDWNTVKSYANHLVKTIRSVKKGLPVIVMEFRLSDASGNGAIDQKEENRWSTLLNQYKMGRVCWNLSNKDEASALIRSSCQKVNGWNKSDLTAHGKWLMKAYGRTL